jgi:hypothetical protein
VDGPAAVVVIQEAGLDGFWMHRLLQARSRKTEPELLLLFRHSAH